MSPSLTDSLFKWVRTFDKFGVVLPAKSIIGGKSNESFGQYLTDAVFLSQVCHHICPEYFNQEFLNKIKVGDTNSSAATQSSPNLSLDWRVKSSNLKKLIESVNDFLDSVLESTHHQDAIQVDAVKIARNADIDELTKLLQLILGCAVNCEKQEMFVQVILNDMETEDQLNVKKALESFIPISSVSMNNGHEVNPAGDGQLRSIKRSSRHGPSDDSMAQELFDLKREISCLKEQNAALADQNEDLTRKNQQLQQEMKNAGQDGDLMSTRSKMSTNSGQRLSRKSDDLIYDDDGDDDLMSFKETEILKLRKKTENLKEELFRTTNQRDQLNQTIEYLKSQLNEESMKKEDLARKLQDMKNLKDEVDILRSKNEAMKLNEMSIENYRKKIDDLNEVIRGLRLSSGMSSSHSNGNLRSSTTNLYNADSSSHVSSTSDERDRTFQNLKAQNEFLKKQVSETNAALAELSSVSMKKELEFIQMKDRLEAVEDEKLKYEQQLKEQSAVILGLREEMKAQNRTSKGSFIDVPVNDLFSIDNPPTDKDLRSQLFHDDQEQVTILKKRIDDLKREVLLRESLSHDHISRIRELEVENKNLKDDGQVTNNVKESSFEESDGPLLRECHELREKSSELEQLLAKKEEEIAELNERYRKCVTKAKQVARVLENTPLAQSLQLSSSSDQMSTSANNQQPSQSHPLLYPQPPSSFEIQMQQLMSLVTERDKTISELELEHEKMKAFKDVEERLMSSAFHQLATKLQRNAADERINGSRSSNITPLSGAPATRSNRSTPRTMSQSVSVSSGLSAGSDASGHHIQSPVSSTASSGPPSTLFQRQKMSLMRRFAPQTSSTPATNSNNSNSTRTNNDRR